MNGVSQNAHFIIESDVITASLHAQLNAKIAPGVVPVVVVVVADGVETTGAFAEEECARLFECVSVLSQSFCNAANGWLEPRFEPVPDAVSEVFAPDKLSNIELNAPKLPPLAVLRSPFVLRGVPERSLLAGLLVLFLQGLADCCC